MALEIPERTVESVYRNIWTAGRALKAWLPGAIAKAGASHGASWVANECITTLHNASQTYPPSSLFTTDWQDRLAAFANTQVETQRTREQYITDFDGAGDAIRAALAAAIASLPVDADGYVLAFQYTNGEQAWRTLPADATLKAALEAVQAALN